MPTWTLRPGESVEGGFFNQGEACTAASRTLVHRDVYDEVVKQVGAAVASLSSATVPIRQERTSVRYVTQAQQSRVLDYLRIGREEGARIAAQADLPTDPELANSFFVPPTLFADVNPDMQVAQEEIFGPVVSVIPFDDEAEAIQIANGTPTWPCGRRLHP